MPREAFVLHPQLAADTHPLGATATALVLLHRNAAVPWLILVPTTDVGDFLDLPAALRTELLADCEALVRYLKTHRQVEKINFAAIGNLVPQLHLHVVGRRRDDPCWPLPVWGHLQVAPGYTDAEVAGIQDAVMAALGCP